MLFAHNQNPGTNKLRYKHIKQKMQQLKPRKNYQALKWFGEAVEMLTK